MGEIIACTRCKRIGPNPGAYARWIAHNQELVEYKGKDGVLSTVGFDAVRLHLVHATRQRFLQPSVLLWCSGWRSLMNNIKVIK